MTDQPKRLSSGERREALLKAAREIFIKHGYVDTSLEMIIDRAGGSRRSIYKEFGGKEGLFHAIVDENAAQITAGLKAFNKDEDFDVREELRNFSSGYLRVLFGPNGIGVFRIVQMECLRFPKLVRRFFESGPEMALKWLTDLFEIAAVKGYVNVADPRLAADHFMSMIRGQMHLRLLLGLTKAPAKRELDEFITSAVGTFLNGIAGINTSTLAIDRNQGRG